MTSDEDFYDRLAMKWFFGTEPEPKGEVMKDDELYVDDDEQLWNGLTPTETANTASVKGLIMQAQENPAFKEWSVISPKHYKDVVPGYEYMDVMEHVLGFHGVIAHLRGQIFKYLFRFGKKDAESLEAGKIAWYATRLKDVMDRYKTGNVPIRLRDEDK